MRRLLQLAVLCVLCCAPSFAAKQIVILNTFGDGQTVSVTAAYWFPVPAQYQAAQATICTQCQSAWKGAAAGDNAALQNGTVVEFVYTLAFPQGTSTASMKAALLQKWNNVNTNIVWPTQYYGVFLDSVSGWSQ
jgi:hypothetical protein